MPVRLRKGEHTPPVYGQGDKVRFLTLDESRGDLVRFEGWIRDLRPTQSGPLYWVFNSGEGRWAGHAELERLDINPHPGMPHQPPFCANCGY